MPAIPNLGLNADKCDRYKSAQIAYQKTSSGGGWVHPIHRLIFLLIKELLWTVASLLARSRSGWGADG